MRTARLAAGCASVVLGAVLVVGCGSGDDGASGPTRRLNVTLTDVGCSPSSLSTSAGRVQFFVTNPSSSSATRFEVSSDDGIEGSVSNVLGGLSRSMTVTLEAGSYSIRCSGGGIDVSGPLVVQ